MAKQKTSARALGPLVMELTDDQLRVLVASENRARVKTFADGLIAEEIATTYVVAISDEEVPENLRYLVPKYRKLAVELGYSGPVAWRVREGFTLKNHAPKAGPCRNGFRYLQGWELQNDESTKKSIVFWIPRLSEGSTSKTKDNQLTLLAKTRKRLVLPEHHLSSFGPATLLSGLIFAHFKRTGERVPLRRLGVRTDTLHADGNRLLLGFFGEDGLRCGFWDGDGVATSYLGCFPPGVELLSA